MEEKEEETKEDKKVEKKEEKKEDKKEDKNQNKKLLSHLKDINKNISFPKKTPKLKINIQKETINMNSSNNNTDKVISRNNKINNFRNIISKKENSKEKNMIIYTEKKSDNSKEKICSIIAESHYPLIANINKGKIKKNQMLSESSSQSNNNIFQNTNKIKEIINNRIKKRPFSKLENIEKDNTIKSNDIYTSISHRSKNMRLDCISNRNKENNKEIYFNKNIETNLYYIKDKDIIDRPLVYNQSNFEIVKERGGLENKILELEYFTKKKFDELVKEIKNFIPIHFNSYLKDYTIMEITNKQKKKKTK